MSTDSDHYASKNQMLMSICSHYSIDSDNQSSLTLDTSVHNNCEGDVEANSSSDSSIEMDVVSHTFAQDEISTIDETALIFRPIAVKFQLEYSSQMCLQ